MPRGRPFQKGNKPPGGRPKGAQAKTTREVKEAIALAFDQIGGQEAFNKWAKANPDIFYQHIWTKLLPLKLHVDNTLRLETVIEVRQHLIESGIPVDRVVQLFEVPQIPEQINGETHEPVVNGNGNGHGE